MGRYVDFDKYLYEDFCDMAMLNEDEKIVLLYKIKGYGIIKTATELNFSEAKVSRIIRKTKDLYYALHDKYGQERFPYKDGVVPSEFLKYEITSFDDIDMIKK